MSNKKIRDTHNDGFLQYGTKETARSAKGKRIGGDKFVQIGRLAFKELSCRDSDYELAKALTATLNLKVRTLCPPTFKRQDMSKLKVLLNNIEYDVIKADSDYEKRYLYFYLQEVGAVDEVQGEDE